MWLSKYVLLPFSQSNVQNWAIEPKRYWPSKHYSVLIFLKIAKIAKRCLIAGTHNRFGPFTKHMKKKSSRKEEKLKVNVLTNRTWNKKCCSINMMNLLSSCYESFKIQMPSALYRITAPVHPSSDLFAFKFDD